MTVAAPISQPWWKPLLSPAEIRKALVVVVTVVGQALALNLLHGNAEKWATLGLGVAAVFGVFGIPNRIGVPGTYVPGAPSALTRELPK